MFRKFATIDHVRFFGARFPDMVWPSAITAASIAFMVAPTADGIKEDVGTASGPARRGHVIMP